MVHALTDIEWAKVKQFYPSKIIIDKNTMHLVFYETANIIGYALIYLSEKHATLIYLYIEDYLEETFLKICERCLLQTLKKELQK